MHSIYAKWKAYIQRPKIFTYWHNLEKRRLQKNDLKDTNIDEISQDRKRVIIDEIQVTKNYSKLRDTNCQNTIIKLNKDGIYEYNPLL
jgi:hypothetical protein